MNNRIYTSPRFLWTLIFLLVAVTFWLGFGEDIKRILFPQNTVQQAGPIVTDAPVVTCSQGDKECFIKNEKVIANKLPGSAPAYARHQCDGPHPCPTPQAEMANEAIAAIRSYAKETKLELVRITGVTPAGLIYYCAPNSACWSYDTKEKKVTEIENTEPPTTPSLSASPTTTNR